MDGALCPIPAGQCAGVFLALLGRPKNPHHNIFQRRPPLYKPELLKTGQSFLRRLILPSSGYGLAHLRDPVGCWPHQQFQRLVLPECWVHDIHQFPVPVSGLYPLVPVYRPGISRILLCFYRAFPLPVCYNKGFTIAQVTVADLTIEG